MKILLINPNTNEDTTRMMVSIARQHAPQHWNMVGLTQRNSATVINTPELLEIARQEILMRAAQGEFEDVDAVIVSAFGDPALEALRSALAVPVVGIGESAIQAAMHLAQPFAIVSITPQLSQSTQAQVERVGGLPLFAGIYYTADNDVFDKPGERTLADDITLAANRALNQARVSTLIIAGGPLANIASHLVLDSACRVIQPLPCAVNKLVALM